MAHEIEYGLNTVGHFRLLNFATGSYQCTCSICGEKFTGDKYAGWCLACALKVVEELVQQTHNSKKMPCCTKCKSERVTVICNECGFKHCM